NLVTAIALAGVPAATGAGGSSEGPGGQWQLFIIMFGVIFLLYYFIIERGRRKDDKKVEDMRSAVRKGDKVVTIGGIHGVVQAVDISNNTVTVQVDKNVKIEFSKSAIQTVTRKDEEKSEKSS